MRSFGDEEFFVLKADVRKYFPSIDQGILLQLIQKKIADQRTLRLIKNIINSLGIKKGIPIGNLTSQLFANIYLNELDQFAKHYLKIKYYCRYVDDFVILHRDRKQLKEWRSEIKDFLSDRLNLELHPKKQEIFPAMIGIDFLGYHIFIDHILVRQSIVHRFLVRLKSGRMPLQSICSYIGHFKFADSFGLIHKVNRVYVKRYTNFS